MKILMFGNQRKGTGTAWNEELFREELARRTDVSFYGWGYDPKWGRGYTVFDIVERFGKPDVALIHYDITNYTGFSDIDALKVWISGDFYEGAFRWGNYLNHIEHCDYDVSFGYSPYVVKYLEKYNVGKKQYLLHWGIDTYRFRNLRIEKTVDVSAIYARARKHKLRKIIHNRLAEMRGECGLSIELGKYYFDEYVLKLNQSKITINANPEFKFVNPKVLEALACGTFLLTDRNDEFEGLGYKDGEHLVFYDNMRDLEEKIFYYLKNEDEREEIAENGRIFIRERYSLGHRAERFLSIIESNL